MRWWKMLGLAGFVGVAATGAVVARDQRQRNAYTPDEIRDRLQARLEEISDAAAEHATADSADQPPTPPSP
jgi:hypothetical protein